MDAYLEDVFFCFREFREVLAVFFQGKKTQGPRIYQKLRKKEKILLMVPKSGSPVEVGSLSNDLLFVGLEKETFPLNMAMFGSHSSPC